jgi:hypothetical protein
MQNLRKVLLVAFVAFVFAGLLAFFFTRLSYTQREIALRTTIVAQNKDNENVFDAMWKTIHQQAGVAEKYKDAFMKVYPQIISGRYQGGGDTLMKWIVEHNPTFDTSLYAQLMDNIQSLRREFMDRQTLLIDKNREYEKFRQDPYTKFFIGEKPALKIVVITSTRTEKVFQSGKDDDVEL